MDAPLIWSTADLQTLKGWGPAEIRRAVREGRLLRLRRGTFTEATGLSPAAEHRARVRAALRTLGDSTVISHASAAVLQGLPVQRALLQQVWVTRAKGSGGCTATLRATRAPVPPDERTTVAGITMTSVARIVADLARTVPFEWGVAAADAALRQGTELASLEATLASGARRPGQRRARRVVGFADAGSESAGESLSRATFLLQHLPIPHVQFEVRTASGAFVARGDFGWEEQGVIGEFDGALKYDGLDGRRPADVVMAEKEREQALRDEGWWIVRWGWRELSRPAALAERIRRAFGHAVRR